MTLSSFTPSQISGVIALLILTALTVVLILHHLHEMKYIKRAAKFLSIPKRFVFFFHHDLWWLFKKYPSLKNIRTPIEFLMFVVDNEPKHYECIKQKLDNLYETEEQYGEGFIEEQYSLI